MSRSGIALAMATVLLALATALFFLKVGALIPGPEQLDRRVGYCFDVATDRAGSRLYVAAGPAGLHVFGLAQGDLQYVSTYYDGGYYRNLKVWQDRAYLADSERGLVVLDISGETPVTTWVQPGGQAGGVEVKAGKAYVAAWAEGLQVFDLADPDAPVLLGATRTAGDAWDVWVRDGLAYVADFHSGLTVVDVSVPTQPRPVGQVTWAERYQTAEIVRGEGDAVYVAAASQGLIVVDISDPAHPVVASRYRPVRIGYAEGLAVQEGIVYLAWRSRIKQGKGERALVRPTVENGLHVLDTRDPYAPSLLGKVSFTGMVEGVHVADDVVYMANAFLGVRSIDVRDPEHPLLLDTVSTLGSRPGE
jgi:hypothetical protein